jgi:hypothetical protein
MPKRTNRRYLPALGIHRLADQGTIQTFLLTKF